MPSLAACRCLFRLMRHCFQCWWICLPVSERFPLCGNVTCLIKVRYIDINKRTEADRYDRETYKRTDRKAGIVKDNGCIDIKRLISLVYIKSQKIGRYEHGIIQTVIKWIDIKAVASETYRHRYELGFQVHCFNGISTILVYLKPLL